MEHINYLYYTGVLQNLKKNLSNSSHDNKEAFSRAIEKIESRLKEYETKPQKASEGQFLKHTYQDYLSKASYDFKNRMAS